MKIERVKKIEISLHENRTCKEKSLHEKRLGLNIIYKEKNPN